jgi:hypothetical protein
MHTYKTPSITSDDRTWGTIWGVVDYVDEPGGCCSGRKQDAKRFYRAFSIEYATAWTAPALKAAGVVVARAATAAADAMSSETAAAPCLLSPPPSLAPRHAPLWGDAPSLLVPTPANDATVEWTRARGVIDLPGGVGGHAYVGDYTVSYALRPAAAAAAAATALELRFTRFDVEDGRRRVDANGVDIGRDCAHDAVTIYTGSPSQPHAVSLCGGDFLTGAAFHSAGVNDGGGGVAASLGIVRTYELYERIRLDASAAVLVFHSDARVHRRGFRVEFRLVQTDCTAAERIDGKDAFSTLK